MSSAEECQKEALVSPKAPDDEKATSPRGRQRARPRKRKRSTSESSSDERDALPENSAEVDRNVQESAERNNLTVSGAKKILKKVVTNDIVLAFVHNKEEEESGNEDEVLKPKLTRANQLVCRAKGLENDSPTAPWNLALTPIKQIPVKTTPEITSLMTQDLPDESDEEYQLTNDDVLSDEDPTLESCSDLESQPRTPATPSSQPPESPQTEPTDGPFKVPALKAGVKKVKDGQEEATIARRTRSKLCLSATPIESIEESFVPPDLPPPLPGDIDDLWNNFLTDVLQPTPSFRTEDDDEADPEYNVAADPDTYDEDDEALERSLVNISRKELDDLMDEILCLGDRVPTPILVTPIKPQMDSEETPQVEITEQITQLVSLECSQTQEVHTPNVLHHLPIPIKEEPTDKEAASENEEEEEPQPPRILQEVVAKKNVREVVSIVVSNTNDKIVEKIVCEEEPMQIEKAKRPVILRGVAPKTTLPEKINIYLDGSGDAVMEAAQVLILEQQLRQHVQIAAASYLQIYAHPRLWTYAPAYKDFITGLVRMADERAATGHKSVVEVCNLRAAHELITSWEQTLSEDTPQNKELVKFYEVESEKCLKRNTQNVVYTGTFHDMYMEVVSNSSVFVYPYLLPPVPFRCDSYRRQTYLHSEDCLIALGLEQFFAHVNANLKEYKLRFRATQSLVVGLVVKHMLPWQRQRALNYHIQTMRRAKNRPNPIQGYFDEKKVAPVQHKLLSFNPTITLHAQPEYEVPLPWIRFLSKNNERAHEFVMKRARMAGYEPASVDVDIEDGGTISVPKKNPKRIQLRHNIEKHTLNLEISPFTDKKADVIQPTAMSIIETENGGLLVPVLLVAQGGTVNSTHAPISSTRVAETVASNLDCLDESSMISSTIYHDDDIHEDIPAAPVTRGHCKCCVFMKEVKKKWPLITNYFTSVKTPSDRLDCCVDRTTPRISRRLHCFLLSLKNSSLAPTQMVNSRFMGLDEVVNSTIEKGTTFRPNDTLSERLQNIGDSKELIHLKETLEDTEDQFWVHSCLIKMGLYPLFWKQHRKCIFRLIKEFEIDSGSPINFYKRLSQLLEVGAPELALELVGLLTGAQADQLGRYRDYFIVCHLRKLTSLIREEIKDSAREKEVLSEVSAVLCGRQSPACRVCHSLLSVVRFNRRLCSFLFDVTPHRVAALSASQWSHDQLRIAPKGLLKEDTPQVPIKLKTRSNVKMKKASIQDTTSDSDSEYSSRIQPKKPRARTKAKAKSAGDNPGASSIASGIQPKKPRARTKAKAKSAGDNPGASSITSGIQPKKPRARTKAKAKSTVENPEASSITSGTKGKHKKSQVKTKRAKKGVEANKELEGVNDEAPTTAQVAPDAVAPQVTSNVLTRLPNLNATEPSLEIDSAELTVSKTEVEDPCSPDARISSLPNTQVHIKPEPVDWSREEDKILLEAITRNNPEITTKKTVIEVFEAKGLFSTVQSDLTDKSQYDIRERIVYLLQLLCTNGSS